MIPEYMLVSTKLSRAINTELSGRNIIFEAPFETQGKPWRGKLNSFTCASGDIVTDYFNREIAIQPNEMGLNGARRVEQLLSSSITTQSVTLDAGSYVYAHSGVGNVSLSGAIDGSYGSVVTTVDEIKRLAFTVTVQQSVTITVNSAPDNFSLTDTTGDTDPTIPDEFIDTDTDYGAGVNGVAYFNTDKSHISVDANGVVTYGNNYTYLSNIRGLPSHDSITNLCDKSWDIEGWADNWFPGTVTNKQYKGLSGKNTLALITGGTNTYDGKFVVVTLSDNTTYTVQCALTEIASVKQRLGIQDSTVSAWIGYIDISWSGGVPSVSASSGASNILITDHYSDGSVYKISFELTTSLVASNTTRILFQPDRNGTSKSVAFGDVVLHANQYIAPLIPTNDATATLDQPQTTFAWPANYHNDFVIAFDLYCRQEPSNEFIMGNADPVDGFQFWINNANYRLEKNANGSWPGLDVAHGGALTNTIKQIALHFSSVNGFRIAIDGVLSSWGSDTSSLYNTASNIYYSQAHRSRKPYFGDIKNLRIQSVSPNATDAEVLAV